MGVIQYLSRGPLPGVAEHVLASFVMGRRMLLGIKARAERADQAMTPQRPRGDQNPGEETM